jgi:ribosome-associated protein
MSVVGPPDAPEPGGLAVAPGIKAPRGAVRWRFARSGGPGGQNVNKLNTKAELRIDPRALAGLSPSARGRLAPRLTRDGELVVVSDRERTQERNRMACLDRLRAILVAVQVEPLPRRPTRPTRGSRERRMTDKRARGEAKRRRRPPGSSES